MSHMKSLEHDLDDPTIDKIVQLLDAWNGKLTWDLFIDAVEKVMHTSYSRHALDRHQRIKDAFKARKVVLQEIAIAFSLSDVVSDKWSGRAKPSNRTYDLRSENDVPIAVGNANPRNNSSI